MKKIIIIGPAGAGKSTLAKALAHKLGLPHYELDAINHQENWTPIDRDEFRRIVEEKTHQDSWVFCGNYFSTLGFDFWRKADTIIWCDYSFPLVMTRLFKRTVRRTLTKEELWNGNKEGFITNFFTKDSIFVWMIGSWKKQQRRYNDIFTNGSSELPAVQLVRLKNPKETKSFLRNIH